VPVLIAEIDAGFMRAYCVFDTYNFSDYEPVWT